MAENKFLDDIAKFGNSTLTAMGGMQKQVRTWVKEQVETLIENMDLVTKKEIQAHNLGISKLMARVEELEHKIAKLEGGKPAASAAPKAKAKTAAKPKAKTE